MNYSYENGKIVVKDKCFSDTVYHVFDECISVIFGGKGAICDISIACDICLAASDMPRTAWREDLYRAYFQPHLQHETYFVCEYIAVSQSETISHLHSKYIAFTF